MTRQECADTPIDVRGTRVSSGRPRFAGLAGPVAVAISLLVAACHSTPALPIAVASVPGLTPSNSDGGASDYTVNTGAQVLLDSTGSNSQDPLNPKITYAWTFPKLPAGSHAAFDRPDAPAPRFTADVSGAYVVQLVVRTDVFVSDPAQLTITARPCGRNAPTVGTIVATNNSPGVGVAVRFSAPNLADADNAAECGGAQTFTHAWSVFSQPAGSTAKLNLPQGLTPTLMPDVQGDYVIQLVVTDSTGLSSAPAQLSITAGACGGNPPVISALIASNVQPGIGTVETMTATVTDVDNNTTCNLNQTFRYHWAIVAQPRGSTAQLNDPTIENPSFSPDVGGTYTVRLTVVDSTERSSAAKDLDIQASGCGGAAPQPAIVVPASASIGQPVLLSSTVTDTDITECSLSQSFDYFWALRGLPPGSQATLNNPNSVSPSFTPDFTGTYIVELHVIDSGGVESVTVSARVNVTTCGGSSPSIDALTASPTLPNSGQQVRITPTISDGDSACADFDPARTYDWTLVSRPAGSGAFIRDPSASVAVFGADVPGTYQVGLLVKNASGHSSDLSILNVVVGACGFAAPSLSNALTSNASPSPGTAVTLSVDVADADQDPPCSQSQSFSLRWTQLARPPGSNAVLSNPAAARPQFTPDKPGGYQFSVVATDQSGLHSDPAFVTLTATNCGTSAPTVDATPALFTTQPGTAVQLAAQPSDSDVACGITQTFTYAWAVVAKPDGSSPLLSDPGSAAPQFTPDAPGEYSLQVIATDSSGLASAPAYVRIVATGCTQLPPSVGSISVAAGALGSTSIFTANNVSNLNCSAGAAALRYQWTLTQRPIGSNAALATPTATSTTLVSDVSGAYQVSLVVTNGAGLSSSPAFGTLNIASCGSSQFSWDPTTPIVTTATEPDGSPIVGQPHVGSTIGLAAQFTDANPTCSALPVAPFTYRWSLVSRPSGSSVSLSSTSDAAPALVPDAPGLYQLAVTVSDALGTISPVRTLTISTDSCGFIAPTAQLSPSASTINQRASVDLSASASTDDSACPARLRAGAISQFAWSVAQAPNGAGTVLTATQGTSSTCSAAVARHYVIAMTATGANGLASVPATATVDVNACGGHEPAITRVVSTIGATTSSRPNVGSTVTLTATAFDADSACTPADFVQSYTFTLISAPSGSGVSLSGLPQGANNIPL
ncbi:MAG: hypothetical protein JST92_20555, partial [Deltaproteobacteria bacterium]|nr:hypothetical protein [Deltaproteobacteria bacterium]